MASKKMEVRAQLARTAEELSVMAGLSEEDGFDQELYDKKEATIAELKAQVARIERGERLAAELSLPSAQPRAMVPAEPRKLHASLRAYKDRVDRNGRIVRGEDAAYGVGQWVKATVFGHRVAQEWCEAHGIITRAQSEAVDSAGGFLVPEQMMQAIIDLRDQYGAFRQNAQVVPMTRDTLNWPRRAGGLTAYFIGENQTLTESQASWDNVQLTAKKVGILARFSTELEEDSVISIADWLTNEMAWAFARKEDDCALNGTGTSTYGGIVGLLVQGTQAGHAGSVVTAAAGHDTFGEIDYVDIGKVLALLPNYALPNAKWYCSQTCFAACFERLTAQGAGNTIDMLTGAITYSFLGYPIVIMQMMPQTITGFTSGATMLMFGDLRLASAMGDRRSITVRRSDERWFDADQIGMMATERIDIVNHDVGTASVPGPIVFLASV